MEASSLCLWGLGQALPVVLKVGGRQGGGAWVGRAQERHKQPLPPSVGLAGGWGRGSVHWGALQHRLGPPPQPLCPEKELLRFLDHTAALEGDRDPTGSACLQGRHL